MIVNVITETFGSLIRMIAGCRASNWILFSRVGRAIDSNTLKEGRVAIG